MTELIILALIAGIGISLTTGMLGCFVVWRKMSYFGDSLAHSALFGIAIALSFDINQNIGIFISALTFALLLNLLQTRNFLATDTILGILAHAGLAIALVILSLIKNYNFDLESFLFGDILLINKSQILTIYLGLIVTSFILIKNWEKFILLTISKDLAAAKGINCNKLDFLFILLMTITVAISIKIIGVLLITSMLIIPAATSKLLSNSPKQMAFIACLIGSLSIITGILFSFYTDTPTGPSIICSALLYFALSSFVKRSTI